jgi:hypothetical protein
MKLTKQQKDRYKMLIIRLLDYYKIDVTASKNIKDLLVNKWINIKSDINISKQIERAKNSLLLSNRDRDSYLLNLNYER